MLTMVLDIGGTAIKSGLYDNGELSAVRETPTDAKLGGAHVVERAIELIEAYRESAGFQRIGISTAGQVDAAVGRIIYANENIPGYTGMELKDIMEKKFRVPVAVENDVNAAAIGESIFGAGKGVSDFVCLTYGTGVGGAIFVNGKLYSGSSCSAGEFGGIVTHPQERDIAKGGMFSGCYEKYASATALVSRAKQLEPSLSDGRAVFAQQDRPEVRAIIDGWIMEIIYGLITIVYMLNPSCIILGGGVMEQPYVLEQIREKLYQHIMPSFRHVRIEKARLGNRAGMLGAAMLDVHGQL